MIRCYSWRLLWCGTFGKHNFFVRGGLIAIALLALISCQQKAAVSNPLTGTISATSINPLSGKLEGLVVRLTNNSNVDLRLDFSVRSLDHQTYWKTVSSANVRAHATQTFSLKPETIVFRPFVGDYLMVFATDRDGNDSYFVADGYVHGVTTRLINGQFSDWRQAPRLPVMWTPSVPKNNEKVSFALAKYDGRKGLQIKLSTTEPDQLHFASVLQRIIFDKLGLRAMVFPTTDCDAETTHPNESGVQLSDDFGSSILYCISSRIHQTHIAEPAVGQLVIAYPGRLGKWNGLDIDPGKFHALARLRPGSDRQISVRLVVGFNPVKDRNARLSDAVAAFSDVRLKH